MGAWSLYFLAKLGLYAQHSIGLHIVPNLLLAAALAWPLRSAAAARLRSLAAIAVAAALLYYDSYLPPFARLLDQAGALGDFRADYLFELAHRFVPLPAVAAGAALVLLFALLRHRLRFSALAFIGLIVAAALPATRPGDTVAAEHRERANDPVAPAGVPGPELAAPELNAALDAFYGAQRGLTVSFARAGTPRFDLILLSVCSLARDDLDFVHQQDSPLLARFDIVFSRFNSAATYSGPAVLRLLHGTCGQTPQDRLYSGTAADDCYLFRNLAGAGYRPALLLNHDGHFDHFAAQLSSQGGIGADPLDNHAAPVTMLSFDGTPIRSDYALLAHWWGQADAGDRHRALLYNTISLHDGDRLPGARGGSRETYLPRLRQLFADLGRFFDLIETSGRPTVVVLIPEHGAALRGDALQVPGLRELPTPAITRVPVAVKLFGFGPDVPSARPGGPLVVDQPSSYLDLTALIAGLTSPTLARPTRAALQGLTHALPATEWVAENDGTVLLRHAGRDYLRVPAGDWAPFSAGP